MSPPQPPATAARHRRRRFAYSLLSSAHLPHSVKTQPLWMGIEHHMLAARAVLAQGGGRRKARSSSDSNLSNCEVPSPNCRSTMAQFIARGDASLLSCASSAPAPPVVESVASQQAHALLAGPLFASLSWLGGGAAAAPQSVKERRTGHGAPACPPAGRCVDGFDWAVMMGCSGSYGSTG